MCTNVQRLSFPTRTQLCQLTFEENKCFPGRQSVSIAQDIPFKKWKRERQEWKEKDGTCSFQWRSLGT